MACDCGCGGLLSERPDEKYIFSKMKNNGLSANCNEDFWITCACGCKSKLRFKHRYCPKVFLDTKRTWTRSQSRMWWKTHTPV